MLKTAKLKRSTLKTTLVSIAALIVLWSGISTIFVKYVYDQHFTRVNLEKMSGYLRYDDVKEKYPRTLVHFKSSKNTLAGYIYGAGNRSGLIVVSHGLGFGAEDYLAQILYFVDRGWTVFAFDNTGTYGSEGNTAVGLPQSLIDLDAALTYIESNATLSKLPVALFGHSWGAYAVTAILRYDHDINAVVSVSGFDSPKGLLAEQLKSMTGPLVYLVYPFGWAYQRILFGDTANVTAVDGINATDTPVMIVHGNEDEAISYDGASIIAHRNQITNPNVVFKTCSTPNRNGHNSLLRSAAAIEYRNQANQIYEKLYDNYKGNIPGEVRAQFYQGIDKFKSSELDAALMTDINAFFKKALGRM